MKTANENLKLLKVYSKEVGASYLLLKSIYEGCGADLNKILRVTQTNTNWTINKICDVLRPQKDEVILFIADKKQGEYHKRQYGFLTYSREYEKADNRVSGLSAFYSKKEFNEARKDPGYKTIFLLLKRDDIKGNQYVRLDGYDRIRYELKELNNNNRYMIERITNGRCYEYNINYISAADIKNINRKKSSYIHFIPNCCTKSDFEKAPKAQNEIIDKSGYYLLTKREYLRREASRLRAQKQLAEVKTANIDTQKIITEIETNFQKTNMALCAEIETCNLTKAEDIQKLDFLIKILKDFQFSVSFFEKNTKNKLLNKSFNNMTDFNKTISEYNEKSNLNIKTELQKQADWLADFNKRYNR